MALGAGYKNKIKQYLDTLFSAADHLSRVLPFATTNPHIVIRVRAGRVYEHFVWGDAGGRRQVTGIGKGLDFLVSVSVY